MVCQTEILSLENSPDMALSLIKHECRSLQNSPICTRWCHFKETELSDSQDQANKPNVCGWSYHTFFCAVMKISESCGTAEMNDKCNSKPTVRTKDTHHTHRCKHPCWKVQAPSEARLQPKLQSSPIFKEWPWTRTCSSNFWADKVH